ncbi:MAG: fibrobacter succinogenes major paralogous domain-containing protein [Hallerella sp.]|nr:fibrobacter succinogenes major paralogous domain-containing protein [Hallerella sp.]
MPISFIAFLIIGIIIIAAGAFLMGARISKAAQKEASKKANQIPYAQSLAENTAKFNYGSFTDARDGETYRTVQIGNQVWMAENLRFQAEGSFPPNNQEENVKEYGRLYTWHSALGLPEEPAEDSTASHLDLTKHVHEKNYQGIAPEGWHIPSNKEWEELLAQLKADEDLRSACEWRKPGKDSLGFFALPAGYRFGNGSFLHFGDRTRFWSKDKYCGRANAYRLSITEESMDIEGVYRCDAVSVRCIKNT